MQISRNRRPRNASRSRPDTYTVTVAGYLSCWVAVTAEEANEIRAQYLAALAVASFLRSV